MSHLSMLFAVGNYSLRDYGTVALFTGFSVPFGYWSGIYDHSIGTYSFLRFVQD